MKSWFIAYWEALRSQWITGKKSLGKLFVIVMVTIVFNELLFRGNPSLVVRWLVENPVSFLMNLALLSLISCMGILLYHKVYWTAMAVLILGTLLGGINANKYALRNIPLVADDLFLIREVCALLPEIINERTVLILGIALPLIVVIALLLKKWLENDSLKKHPQIIATFMALNLAILGMGHTIYSRNSDAWEIGFFYSLTNSLRSEQTIDHALVEAASEQLENYQDETSKTSDIKPNVIIIMSEAFWDINKLGVQFNKNPIANFEQLRSESLFGELYVPVFGGATANPEFEVLTGLSLKNFSNDWHMVFPNEIKKPIPSLASIYRNQGYTSYGLHPFRSWYYNRLEVYEHLGFETFKTIEYMDGAEMASYYVSDKYLTDEIIHMLKHKSGPLFHFTVTMQNHGPYANKRFEPEEMHIKLLTELSSEASFILNNYAEGLYLSDLELKRLVDFLRDFDEPTLLLFFGDHLPMLGQDYLTYRETGYVSDESNLELQQDLRIMGVPYILWSNYDTPVGEMPVMNASFVTPLVLEHSYSEIPSYLKAVRGIWQEMPLILRSYSVDRYGQVHGKDSEAYLEARAKYQAINNEIFSSNSRLDLDKWLVADNAAYNTMLNQMQIERVLVGTGQTTIYGSGFYLRSEVRVNGEPVWHTDSSNEHFVINRNLKTGDEVQLFLLDSERNIINQSNVYIVEEGS